MSEISVYIENQSKSVDVESMGAWFTFPVSVEEIAEKIGLNSQNEEYAILDYESPFPIDTDESLEYLNEVARLYEEYSSHGVTEYLGELVYNGSFSTIGEAFDSIDELHYYVEKEDLIDYLLEVAGVPSEIRYYIDEEKYFSDLRISRNLYETSDGGVIEMCI